MPQQHWWGVGIQCVKCESQTQLTNLLFSADGSLKFISVCMECEISISWEVTATKLQHQAWVNDISAFMKQATLIENTPQLPPPVFSDDDKSWLKTFHITEAE